MWGGILGLPSSGLSITSCRWNVKVYTSAFLHAFLTMGCGRGEVNVIPMTYLTYLITVSA